MDDLKKEVSAIKVGFKSMMDRLDHLEKSLHQAVEGDRRQLDVFSQKHESGMQKLIADVHWIKEQWKKFSRGVN